jgi:hypothetical protein
MAKAKRTFRKINKRNKKNNKSKRRVLKRNTRRMKGGGIGDTYIIDLRAFEYNESTEEAGKGINPNNKYYKINLIKKDGINTLSLDLNSPNWNVTANNAVLDYNKKLKDWYNLTLTETQNDNNVINFTNKDGIVFKISTPDFKKLELYKKVIKDDNDAATNAVESDVLT